MERRNFIQVVGLSSLGLSFGSCQNFGLHEIDTSEDVEMLNFLNKVQQRMSYYYGTLTSQTTFPNLRRNNEYSSFNALEEKREELRRRLQERSQEGVKLFDSYMASPLFIDIGKSWKDEQFRDNKTQELIQKVNENRNIKSSLDSFFKKFEEELDKKVTTESDFNKDTFKNCFEKSVNHYQDVVIKDKKLTKKEKKEFLVVSSALTSFSESFSVVLERSSQELLKFHKSNQSNTYSSNGRLMGFWNWLKGAVNRTVSVIVTIFVVCVVAVSTIAFIGQLQDGDEIGEAAYLAILAGVAYGAMYALVGGLLYFGAEIVLGIASLL